MNYYTAIETSVSLGGLVLIVFLYGRYLVVSIFREKMFALRDELFDEARAGKLQFDQPAYLMLRKTMNGMIQFGHRINIPLVVTFQLLSKSNNFKKTKFIDHLFEANRSLSEEQRKIIYSYHKQMHKLVVEHLVFSSPILMVTIFAPFAIMAWVSHHFDRVLSVFRRPIDRIDSLAYAT